jgi:predicted esterase
MLFPFFLWSSSPSKTTYSYQVSRHNYTSSDRYEQSLDVYHVDYNDRETKKRPVIVLVMGSGWMGHAAWLYTLTGWWNARGPKSISSRLGYTCISIRHSGGFFHYKAMASHAILLCIFFPDYVIFWLLLLLILCMQGQDAATSVEDMMDDVATAFDYIETNSTELGIGEDTKLIIGGYSSGAHLLAHYVNQQPQLSEQVCGILYISGVLSLDCWAMNAITMTVFGRWTWDLPSPIESVMESPIASLPHLLVGCHNELFGLPILNGTFCSEEYCEKVRRGNSASKCVLVSSNHWFVLSSQALTDALAEHIPLVILKGEE